MITTTPAELFLIFYLGPDFYSAADGAPFRASFGGWRGTQLAATRVMTILDLTIIYLACGSPFAVHLLVTRNGTGSNSSAAFAIARLALWPVILIQVAFRVLTGLAVTSTRGSLRAEQAGLHRERSTMETSEPVSNGTVPLFEFRDAFLRYANLSLESKTAVSSEAVSEIFEISMHPEPSLATACLDRKNRFRLIAHQNDARRDFIEMAQRIAGENGSRETVLRSALATALIVKDAEGVRTLRSARGISETRVETIAQSDAGVKVWNAAPHNQPNII